MHQQLIYLTGPLRQEALYWSLGAGVLWDRGRSARKMPNTDTQILGFSHRQSVFKVMEMTSLPTFNLK